MMSDVCFDLFRPDRSHRNLSFIALAVALSLSLLDEAKAQDTQSCVIAEHGVGRINIGMGLKAAKKALPHAVFRRASDGDGAALVSISTGKADLMAVHAGEDDPEAPIDWSRKIRFIETFHSGCKTARGIHPGMLVRDAGKRIGKVTGVVQSEIESREYITFSGQSPRLLFRLDYTGVFDAGVRRTTTLAPEARILSIGMMPE